MGARGRARACGEGCVAGSRERRRALLPSARGPRRVALGAQASALCRRCPTPRRSFVTGATAQLPRLGSISMGALPAGTQYAAAAKGQDAGGAAAGNGQGAGPPLSHLSSAEGEYVCSDSPGQGQEDAGAGQGHRAGSAADERPSKLSRV